MLIREEIKRYLYFADKGSGSIQEIFGFINYHRKIEKSYFCEFERQDLEEIVMMEGKDFFKVREGDFF